MAPHWYDAVISATSPHPTATQILDAAIDLADQRGLEAVTFRVVAGLVGITHSEMYQYFADKDALLAAMFSRVVGPLFSELQISDLDLGEDPSGNAAVVLRSVTLSLRALFTQHPSIVTALTLSDGTGPDFQAPMLAVVNLLERIGIPTKDLAAHYQVLEDYIVGSSLYAMFDHPRHLELRRERLSTTGHAAFESVATSEEAIHTHNERAFEIGVDALIQVILQRAGLLGPALPTGSELSQK